MNLKELKVGDRLSIMFRPASFRPFQIVEIRGEELVLRRADNVPLNEIGTPEALKKYGCRVLTFSRLANLCDLGCVIGLGVEKRMVWETTEGEQAE